MSARLPSIATALAVAVAVALALAHSGEVRERAEAALGRGMPASEAALARGFVLGEDEGIDAGTVEDFRRAGLSHLLSWNQVARTQLRGAQRQPRKNGTRPKVRSPTCASPA
jgi:hypothetical protein